VDDYLRESLAMSGCCNCWAQLALNLGVWSESRQKRFVYYAKCGYTSPYEWRTMPDGKWERFTDPELKRTRYYLKYTETELTDTTSTRTWEYPESEPPHPGDSCTGTYLRDTKREWKLEEISPEGRWEGALSWGLIGTHPRYYNANWFDCRGESTGDCGQWELLTDTPTGSIIEGWDSTSAKYVGPAPKPPGWDTDLQGPWDGGDPYYDPCSLSATRTRTWEKATNGCWNFNYPPQDFTGDEECQVKTCAGPSATEWVDIIVNGHKTNEEDEGDEGGDGNEGGDEGGDGGSAKGPSWSIIEKLKVPDPPTPPPSDGTYTRSGTAEFKYEWEDEFTTERLVEIVQDRFAQQEYGDWNDHPAGSITPSGFWLLPDESSLAISQYMFRWVHYAPRTCYLKIWYRINRCAYNGEKLNLISTQEVLEEGEEQEYEWVGSGYPCWPSGNLEDSPFDWEKNRIFGPEIEMPVPPPKYNGKFRGSFYSIKFTRWSIWKGYEPDPENGIRNGFPVELTDWPDDPAFDDPPYDPGDDDDFPWEDHW
jgi:hypothetical protein